jgi:hypothetical protein
VASRAVQRLGDGRVRIHLKRPFSDGTFAVDMDELAMLARLAAMVPPPWQNQVRYAGVLASASRWRRHIVPAADPVQAVAEGASANDNGVLDPDGPDAPAAVQPGKGAIADTPSPPGTGCRYWPWAFLKRHTFGDDATTCTHCGGPLRLRALLRDSAAIASFLRKLLLPTDAPVPAPARGPPYFAAPSRRIGADNSSQSPRQRSMPFSP